MLLLFVSKLSSPASSASRDATAAASVAAGRPSAAPGPELRRTCRRLPVTKYPTARAFTVCSILRGASTIYPLNTISPSLFLPPLLTTSRPPSLSLSLSLVDCVSNHYTFSSILPHDEAKKSLFNFATPMIIERDDSIRSDGFIMIPGVAHAPLVLENE